MLLHGKVLAVRGVACGDELKTVAPPSTAINDKSNAVMTFMMIHPVSDSQSEEARGIVMPARHGPTARHKDGIQQNRRLA